MGFDAYRSRNKDLAKEYFKKSLHHYSIDQAEYHIAVALLKKLDD